MKRAGGIFPPARSFGLAIYLPPLDAHDVLNLKRAPSPGCARTGPHNQILEAMNGAMDRAAGAVYWLTGLSGAGKTTMSTACVSHFQGAARRVIALDGDVLRKGLCRDLGFSDADRSENVRRAAEVAKLMADTGTSVLVALISPYQSDRDMARRIVGAQRFHEIYLAAPVTVCEARDVKGLYAKARRGDIPGFTGISAPYEPPLAADLVLQTGHESIDACTGRLIAYICRQADPKT